MDRAPILPTWVLFAQKNLEILFKPHRLTDHMCTNNLFEKLFRHAATRAPRKQCAPMIGPLCRDSQDTRDGDQDTEVIDFFLLFFSVPTVPTKTVRPKLF